MSHFRELLGRLETQKPVDPAPSLWTTKSFRGGRRVRGRLRKHFGTKLPLASQIPSSGDASKPFEGRLGSWPSCERHPSGGNASTFALLVFAKMKVTVWQASFLDRKRIRRPAEPTSSNSELSSEDASDISFESEELSAVESDEAGESDAGDTFSPRPKQVVT